jgi:hypothetical protein
MNILIIIVFLIIAYTINAEVKVISVNMGLMAINHAKTLTKVINLEEKKGCLFLKSETYNSATYLYFRCP